MTPPTASIAQVVGSGTAATDTGVAETGAVLIGEEHVACERLVALRIKARRSREGVDARFQDDGVVRQDGEEGVEEKESVVRKCGMRKLVNPDLRSDAYEGKG